jgi:hypothetical protein
VDQLCNLVFRYFEDFIVAKMRITLVCLSSLILQALVRNRAWEAMFLSLSMTT